MSSPPKSSPLGKLLKVILPFKKPPLGKRSVSGYNPKYSTLEQETKRTYLIWVEYAALPSFFTFNQIDVQTQMQSSPLDIMESVYYSRDTEHNHWLIGGNPAYKDFVGEGGEYHKPSSYNRESKFPYMVFRIAEAVWHKFGRGADELADTLPHEILLIPPPTSEGYSIERKNWVQPFQDFIIKRHNLLLQYASWSFGLKHLDDIKVEKDKHGLVLKHIPTGKVRPMYEMAEIQSPEFTRVVPVPQPIPLDPAQWEIFLSTEFDIPMKDAEEQIGSIEVDDEEMQVQMDIDVVEREMLNYWSKHQDLPRTFPILVDKIGKRQEYSKLLRKRSELMEFTHMRDNPSSRSDWDNWKKFFFKRDLSIVKRTEYYTLSAPRQWEAETVEEEEIDQDELNDLKNADAHERAGNLLQIAKDAEKNAKTDDDKKVAESLMKIAVKALDDAEEWENGTWERDSWSDKSETKDFYFEMDDTDGTVRESAVDGAISYLEDEKAQPRDAKFTPGGTYYQEDDELSHEPDWSVSIEYSLEGDWTDAEEEYIWYKITELDMRTHVNWLLYNSKKARDSANTPELAMAAEDMIANVIKKQAELDKFRESIPKLTYPKDILPDKPDYIKIDDYAEHGKCVVKKEYSITPIYEIEGDSESDIVDEDLTEISEEITTFEPDDSGLELWEQAAQYIYSEGGGYESYWRDIDDWYSTEPQPTYSDGGETESNLKPFNWTQRELEKIWDWIAVKQGKEAKFPEPADIGSESIEDIVFEDEEYVQLESEIDEVEREMIRYQAQHPDLPLDYNILSTQIGKRKEYSDLLRKRLMHLEDEEPRKNPEESPDYEPHITNITAIDSMLSGDMPVRLTQRPPSLHQDKSVMKKIEDSMTTMLRLLFSSIDIEDDNDLTSYPQDLVIDEPGVHFESAYVQPWQHSATWGVGGVQTRNQDKWPYEYMNIAKINKRHTYYNATEPVNEIPPGIEVSGIPEQLGDEMFSDYIPIFIDRLYRIFHYGYHVRKFPIFGLITPVVVKHKRHIDVGLDRERTLLSLMHKETGKLIPLYLEPEDGEWRYGGQVMVNIRLSRTLEQAQDDAASLFELPFKPSIEVGEEPISVDEEELNIQLGIDSIEAKVRDHRLLHPYESDANALDAIGLRNEYVALLKKRLALMEEQS